MERSMQQAHQNKASGLSVVAALILLIAWLVAALGMASAEQSNASAGNRLGGVDPSATRPLVPELGKPFTLDALRTVSEIGASVDRGHARASDRLKGLGFDQAIADIKAVDGTQYHDIEAEELIRELYRRAEAHQKGQGHRLLAFLYRQQANEYPAIGSDPNYVALLDVEKGLPPDTTASSFTFVRSAEKASTIELPAHLESAVKALGKVYAGGDLSHLRRIAARAFSSRERPGRRFSLSPYLARSSTAVGALRSALQLHEKPPTHERVVLDLLRATANDSPALLQSSEFMRVVANLEAEDMRAQAEDALHERLLARQNTLPSRIAQIEQARLVDLPGSIEKTPPEAIRRAIERLAELQPDPQQLILAAQRQKAAQDYFDYIFQSFEAPPDDPFWRTASGGEPPGGGGGAGGGEPGKQTRTYDVKGPSPTRGTSSSGPTGPPVSRVYSRAIVSARAARGVAAGAKFEVPSADRAQAIVWVANAADNRLGRFVVQIKPAKGMPFLAATRTMFADSALAAVDLLWGGHKGATAFEEGKILVLFSLDPFTQLDPKASSDQKKRFDELTNKIRAALLSGDQEEIAQIEKEAEALQRELQSQPRRVVVHPALQGREMAWALARIDFWFNKLNGLKEEAEKTSGLRAPKGLFDVDVGRAQTWQFYEQDARISWEPNDEHMRRIRVANPFGGGRYAVSMFRIREDDSGDGDRIEDLEKSVQPMLDWLAKTHPDFVRLNDFSEAFAILRWAKASNVAPGVFDLQGSAPEIATPDRVVIGDGPKVK